MKRIPTNPLPLYSGKKKKASKEKVEKVRSEGREMFTFFKNGRLK